MNFLTAVHTDIGIRKKTNQDSALIMEAETDLGRVLLTVICDGMGGLSKGELASAVVVRAFDEYFCNQLPYEIVSLNWHKLSFAVERKLKDLNLDLLKYGEEHNVRLGTTVTGILAVNESYMSWHVGDTRIYKIQDKAEQLTQDHTFVAREVEKGTMTYEEAMHDKRKNALLQCVGASRSIEPDIRFGNIEANTNYLICSDGFRHHISSEDIAKYLNGNEVYDKEEIEKALRHLTEIVKGKKEQDNISALVIRKR